MSKGHTLIGSCVTSRLSNVSEDRYRCPATLKNSIHGQNRMFATRNALALRRVYLAMTGSLPDLKSGQ
jgi:hypothetical protein